MITIHCVFMKKKQNNNKNEILKKNSSGVNEKFKFHLINLQQRTVFIFGFLFNNINTIKIECVRKEYTYKMLLCMKIYIYKKHTYDCCPRESSRCFFSFLYNLVFLAVQVHSTTYGYVS